MIYSLKGKLAEKHPTKVIVDIDGVGYGVNVPLSTSERLGDVGSLVNLHTRLHVKEDSLELYGFATLDEKQLFELLILVSGIGPRLALGILSGSEVGSFARAVVSGDTTMLTTISGVGKKLAERIVVELRDKMGSIAGASREAVSRSGESPRFNDAVLALVSLGLTKVSAQNALRHVIDQVGGELPVEEMVRRALSAAGR